MMSVNKQPQFLLMIPKPCKLSTYDSILSKNLRNPVKSLSDVIFFDFNISFIWAEIISCGLPYRFFNKSRTFVIIFVGKCQSCGCM